MDHDWSSILQPQYRRLVPLRFKGTSPSLIAASDHDFCTGMKVKVIEDIKLF